MKKSKLALTAFKDERLVELLKQASQKTSAVWAIDCAERVLSFFEERFPEDSRPRTAIETLQTWVETGVFKMAVIRKASLDAHAAAREVGEDNAARSAARATGQAVATAHVPAHALGAAIYALQALYRAADSTSAEAVVAKEREWQCRHLLDLIKDDSNSAIQEWLIAPCGMNCGVCTSYLAMKHDLKKKGFGKKYCPGCIPRGKNCTFMKKHCGLLGSGLVRFCYECNDYPCRRLKALDTRYREKYHMSMIENLDFMKTKGIDKFLAKETSKWRCRKCGGIICCHNGLCYNCELEKLRLRPKYRWDEETAS